MEETALEDVSKLITSQSNDDIKSKPIGILGGGDYGRALAANFKLIGIRYCIGTRSAQLADVEVLSYDEVVERCDIIFLCVPSHVHQNLHESLIQSLAGKTVVDVSNLENKHGASNAIKLQESLLTTTNVVKALNTVSAYTLENIAYGASRDTHVCGDDITSKHAVMQLLREIGLNPIDRGLLRSAIILERMPYAFFPGWGTAVGITLATLLPLWCYYYVYIFWYNQASLDKNINDLPLYVANRAIAWLMTWLLSLTYLPGILAGFLQLIRGSKYTHFPSWLDRWMRCRKQLGLISLLLCGVHACASGLILGSGEAIHMLNKNVVMGVKPNETITLYQSLKTTNQVSLLFAVLSLAVMSVVGISSLPSVNARMTWTEWNFVQSGLGFTSLVFGFVHLITYMYTLWEPAVIKFLAMHPKGYMPPPAFLMPILPMIVIGLKCVLWLPGVQCWLRDIRSGKAGYKNYVQEKQV